MNSNFAVITGELMLSVMAYVHFRLSDDYQEAQESKYTNEIFEKAVESLYGPEIWDKLNK